MLASSCFAILRYSSFFPWLCQLRSSFRPVSKHIWKCMRKIGISNVPPSHFFLFCPFSHFCPLFELLFPPIRSTSHIVAKSLLFTFLDFLFLKIYDVIFSFDSWLSRNVEISWSAKCTYFLLLLKILYVLLHHKCENFYRFRDKKTSIQIICIFLNGSSSKKLGS